MFFHKKMTKLNKVGSVQDFSDSEHDPDYSSDSISFSAESFAETHNCNGLYNCDTEGDSNVMQWSHVSPGFQPQESVSARRPCIITDQHTQILSSRRIHKAVSLQFVDVGLLGCNAVWTCIVAPIVPLKHRYLPIRPCGVTTQKSNFDIFTTVRTSDPYSLFIHMFSCTSQ
jgi:hypothetical protein